MKNFIKKITENINSNYKLLFSHKSLFIKNNEIHNYHIMVQNLYLSQKTMIFVLTMWAFISIYIITSLQMNIMTLKSEIIIATSKIELKESEIKSKNELIEKFTRRDTLPPQRPRPNLR
jgi:cell division protein FtsL